MYSPLLTEQYLSSLPNSTRVGVMKGSLAFVVIKGVGEYPEQGLVLERRLQITAGTTMLELLEQLRLPVAFTRTNKGCVLKFTPNRTLDIGALDKQEVAMLLRSVMFLHTNKGCKTYTGIVI